MTQRPLSPQSWWIDLLLAATLAVAALAVYGPLAGLGLRFGDDGYLAYGVERILEGELIYRDFERGYPPGIFYLYALVFGAFGCDLLYTRIGAVIMLATLAAGTYWLARQLTPRWAAVVAGALVLLVPPPAHKTFVPLAVLAALAICSHLAQHPYRSRTLFWAGLGFGSVALFRHEVAAFGVLIAAGTIAIRESLAIGESGARSGARSSRMWRVWLAWVQFGAGGALVWAPILAFFATQGALFAVVDQLGLAGVRANRGLQIPFPGLFEGVSGSDHTLLSLWEKTPTTLFYFPGVAAACALALIMAQLARGAFDRSHAVVCQWALMAIFMHSLFLHRSDLAHVKQVLVIPALILAYALGRLWRARPRGAANLVRAAFRGRLAVAVVVSVWTLAVLVWGYRMNVAQGYQARARSQALGEPRASVALDPSERETTAKVLGEVRSLTNPGEPIFVAPYAPLYYYLADRQNPTRYDNINPGYFARAEVQEEIIRVLEERRVKLILVRKRSLDGRTRFPNYTPIFAQYMRTRFRRHKRTGEWALHVRREVDTELTADAPR